jgi:hypothetical protein
VLSTTKGTKLELVVLVAVLLFMVFRA